MTSRAKLAQATGPRFLQMGHVGLGREADPRLRLPAALAKARRDERLAALRRMCQLAIERAVDFVLVPGGLFANALVRDTEVQAAIELLAGLAPRPVLIAPGRCDPVSPHEGGSVWDAQSRRDRLTLNWPANVHIFTSADDTTCHLTELTRWPGLAVTGRAVVQTPPGSSPRTASDPPPRPVGGLSGPPPEALPPANGHPAFHIWLLASVWPTVTEPADLADDITRDDPFAVFETDATAPPAGSDAAEAALLAAAVAAPATYVALGGADRPRAGRDSTGRVRMGQTGAAFADWPGAPAATVRGAILGQLSPGGVALEDFEFLPIDTRQVITADVDLSGAAHADEMTRRLVQTLGGSARRGDIVVARAAGLYRPGVALPTNEALRSALGCAHVVADWSAAGPDYDLEAFTADTPGRAAVDQRLAKALMARLENNPDDATVELTQAVLYRGLDALIYQHP